MLDFFLRKVYGVNNIKKFLVDFYLSTVDDLVKDKTDNTTIFKLVHKCASFRD